MNMGLTRIIKSASQADSLTTPIQNYNLYNVEIGIGRCISYIVSNACLIFYLANSYRTEMTCIVFRHIIELGRI